MSNTTVNCRIALNQYADSVKKFVANKTTDFPRMQKKIEEVAKLWNIISDSSDFKQTRDYFNINGIDQFFGYLFDGVPINHNDVETSFGKLSKVETTMDNKLNAIIRVMHQDYLSKNDIGFFDTPLPFRQIRANGKFLGEIVKRWSWEFATTKKLNQVSVGIGNFLKLESYNLDAFQKRDLVLNKIVADQELWESWNENQKNHLNESFNTFQREINKTLGNDQDYKFSLNYDHVDKLLPMYKNYKDALVTSEAKDSTSQEKNDAILRADHVKSQIMTKINQMSPSLSKLESNETIFNQGVLDQLDVAMKMFNKFNFGASEYSSDVEKNFQDGSMVYYLSTGINRLKDLIQKAIDDKTATESELQFMKATDTWNIQKNYIPQYSSDHWLETFRKSSAGRKIVGDIRMFHQSAVSTSDDYIPLREAMLGNIDAFARVTNVLYEIRTATNVKNAIANGALEGDLYAAAVVERNYDRIIKSSENLSGDSPSRSVQHMKNLMASALTFTMGSIMLFGTATSNILAAIQSAASVGGFHDIKEARRRYKSLKDTVTSDSELKKTVDIITRDYLMSGGKSIEISLNKLNLNVEDKTTADRIILGVANTFNNIGDRMINNKMFSFAWSENKIRGINKYLVSDMVMNKTTEFLKDSKNKVFEDNSTVFTQVYKDKVLKGMMPEIDFAREKSYLMFGNFSKWGKSFQTWTNVRDAKTVSDVLLWGTVQGFQMFRQIANFNRMNLMRNARNLGIAAKDIPDIISGKHIMDTSRGHVGAGSVFAALAYAAYWYLVENEDLNIPILASTSSYSSATSIIDLAKALNSNEEDSEKAWDKVGKNASRWVGGVPLGGVVSNMAGYFLKPDPGISALSRLISNVQDPTYETALKNQMNLYAKTFKIVSPFMGDGLTLQTEEYYDMKKNWTKLLSSPIAFANGSSDIMTLSKNLTLTAASGISYMQTGAPATKNETIANMLSLITQPLGVSMWVDKRGHNNANEYGNKMSLLNKLQPEIEDNWYDGGSYGEK